MSPTPPTWPQEIRSTIRLAAPIAAVQLGQMGLGLVDVLMVGRWSDGALAGIALGNMYVWALLVFGYGVLTALDPVVSQAVGAGRPDTIRGAVQRGVALACVVGVPLTLLGLAAEPFFRLLEQPEAVRPLAVAYVHWSMPGILPFVLFVALRQSLQALSTVRPVLWTMLGANALNAALNWVLIFGHLGLPALGLRGSAVASDVSRAWLLIGLLWAGWPVLGPHLRPFDRAVFRPSAWAELFGLGLPIGAQFILEMGAFSAAMLFMGRIGPIELAGHKVALTLASVSFMVPVGISAAAAVRVGYAVGRGDPVGFRRAATVALVLGVGVMTCFGALFLALPGPLAFLFTESAAVVPVAVALIPLAGVFQVFDGIQVVCIGVLRGLAETRTPLIVNIIGFWVVGLPTGWWLAFRAGLGPRGLWWGLVVGLAAVATILLARVAWRLRSTEKARPWCQAPRTCESRKGRPWGAIALIALVVALSLSLVWPMVQQVFGRWSRPPDLELREVFSPGDPTVTFDHAAFDRLLGALVDSEGWVDYAKLADDPRPLDAYLTQLATADLDRLGRDEKLAFLINAYNACTLRLMADHWPVWSIRAIPEVDRWTAERWVVGGRRMSLAVLERDWLRAKFREPRVHFAIAKASVDGPPLRTEAYVGARLEQQLADQMQRIAGSPRWLQLLPESGTLRLTQICLRYAGDFQQVSGTLLEFVRRWSADVDAWCARNGTPRVLWIEDDARHNGLQNRPG